LASPIIWFPKPTAQKGTCIQLKLTERSSILFYTEAIIQQSSTSSSSKDNVELQIIRTERGQKNIPRIEEETRKPVQQKGHQESLVRIKRE